MDSRIKLLFHPLIVIGVFLYASVHILRSFRIYIPHFINGYLTDIICIPIVLTLCITTIRLVKKDPNYWPTAEATLSLTFLFCILFELILPKINSVFTSDPGDILSYFIGLFIYYMLIHRGESSLHNKNK